MSESTLCHLACATLGVTSLMKALGLCAVQCSAVLGCGALLSGGEGSHPGSVGFGIVLAVVAGALLMPACSI